MRNRNHFIGLWLNDEELAHLTEQCEITGLSTSVLIRQTLAGVQLRHKPPNEYAPLLRELSAIGRNINQIAFWANATRSVSEPQIVEAAVLANKAWELVKRNL
ncbi:MAG: plasmid mobilization relaxosome protein MobC [Oscillospiraceae bacterium]|nr:plasmid mobilization relaxosome protein MobC [Oscillospiraceae bacterium]